MRGNYSEVYEPASANERILGAIVCFTIIVGAPGARATALIYYLAIDWRGHAGVNRFSSGWGDNPFNTASGTNPQIDL